MFVIKFLGVEQSGFMLVHTVGKICGNAAIKQALFITYVYVPHTSASKMRKAGHSARLMKFLAPQNGLPSASLRVNYLGLLDKR